MDKFKITLNHFLVDTFKVILKIEEESLKKTDRKDLSISELHLIEAISRKEKRTISEIADDLGITLPSVTAAINKAIGKGYAMKAKAEHDGRAVYVMLTDLGKQVNECHERFHREMVEAISNTLSDSEREQLLELLIKLNKFFYKTLELEVGQ